MRIPGFQWAVKLEPLVSGRARRTEQQFKSIRLGASLNLAAADAVSRSVNPLSAPGRARREQRKKEGRKKGWCERGELNPHGREPGGFSYPLQLSLPSPLARYTAR